VSGPTSRERQAATRYSCTASAPCPASRPARFFTARHRLRRAAATARQHGNNLIDFAGHTFDSHRCCRRGLERRTQSGPIPTADESPLPVHAVLRTGSAAGSSTPPWCRAVPVTGLPAPQRLTLRGARRFTMRRTMTADPTPRLLADTDFTVRRRRFSVLIVPPSSPRVLLPVAVPLDARGCSELSDDDPDAPRFSMRACGLRVLLSAVFGSRTRKGRK